MNLQKTKETTAASFKVGDIIRVFTKSTEDNKVHATSFEGVVIAFRGEKGNKTFTVRKNASDGVSVEKIFTLLSPGIEKIDLVKSQAVRRAKLYYLRNKK